MKLRDNDNAIKDLSRVIKLKPDFAAAFIKRGVAYYENGNYLQAMEDYSRALQLHTEDINLPGLIEQTKSKLATIAKENK